MKFVSVYIYGKLNYTCIMIVKNTMKKYKEKGTGKIGCRYIKI